MAMKAFVHEHGELKQKEMDKPFADHAQVTVAIKAAGLNRRDCSIPGRRGEEPGALILGSDGAGVVDSVGEGVTEFSVGDEVIINPSLGWYENSDAPPEQFEILGMPDNGTFAEYIVLSAEQLEKKPEHLSWDEAGVLALSGLTGYRALFTRGKAAKGETVFIPGAGSGVATFLIQFAKKQVPVSSSAPAVQQNGNRQKNLVPIVPLIRTAAGRKNWRMKRLIWLLKV